MANWYCDFIFNDKVFYDSAMNKIICVLVVFFLTGCVGIPDADVAFADRWLNVGLSEDHALHRTKQRGFFQVDIKPARKPVLNSKTEKIEFQSLPFANTVKINLGFTPVVGKPLGNLRCFHRKYHRIVSSGVRVICWTTDEGGKLTWRQASWKGASL